MTIKQVHFIGIGGIGISAIARMFLGEGKMVSGSDQAASPVTEELAKLGAKISFGHRAENIPADTELAVYTIAIAPDNPELVEAKRRGIEAISYPQMLGRISADKFTIAVAGTHGKTTTTAMIAKIFIDAGLDPTVIVGSLLRGAGGETSQGGLTSGTNFIAGKSRYFIVEACEYRRSFLNLHPTVAVITNIDNDHLDYYKDLADIKSAFAEFAAKVPASGRVIREKEYEQLPASSLQLSVPGKHNVKNAQAAWAVARAVGIADRVAIKALNEFTGTWRRFEFLGRTKSGALVYDDYGHHPTEIKATLAGAREKFPGKKIIAIFQPHLYSRTKLLLDDFAHSFKDTDQVIVLPIYAAREAPDPSISSEILAAEITKTGTPAQAVPDFPAALSSIYNLEPSPSDLILTLGAGDVFKIADKLL